jgi:hypothetical protein
MKINGKQKVLFNGPFYTGFMINTSNLMNQGYPIIQERILNLLHNKDSKDWFIEGKQSNDLIWDTEYTSVYGGTLMVPSSLIAKRFRFTDKLLEYEGINFSIKKILFFYHDYGVGVYRIVVEVDLHESLEVPEFRHLIELFNPLLTDVINPLIERNTLLLKNILEQNNIFFDSFEGISEELKKKSNESLPIRKSLWYHRIFEFPENPEKIPISEESFLEYKRLLYSSQLQGPHNCALNPDVIVIPAFGYSLYIYNKDDRPADIDLNRVVETAQYYYAATNLLDTIMFSKLAELSIKKEVPPKIQDLEEDIKEIKHLSDKLELFLLILKDTIINFNPSSILLWRTLEREWYYVPMVESLQQKNSLLDTKYNELFEELSQKRSQTLNRFVKIFTFFAILGPLIEIYSFAEENNIISILLANLGIILLILIPIGVILGATALYIWKKYFL